MGILIVYLVGFASGFVACLWRREIGKWIDSTRAHLSDRFR